jgi:hypothetical protein
MPSQRPNRTALARRRLIVLTIDYQSHVPRVDGRTVQQLEPSVDLALRQQTKSVTDSSSRVDLQVAIVPMRS